MASSAELCRQLREADAAALARLIEERRDELDLPAARQVLRNPFVDAAAIERLAASRRLISSYEVRRGIASHPRAPRTLALRFVAGLYWADLVRLGVDTGLHPIVRRAADRRIVERLAGLAVGERIVIGRSASAAVLAVVRHDAQPRVLAAVLENPRLTEGLLLPLAAAERAQPRCLALLAADPRWGARPLLRSALCRNPSTPLADALRLLPTLPKDQQRAVAADPRLAPGLRRRARLLAGEGRLSGARRGD